MTDYGPLLEEVRRLRWRAERPARGGLPGAHPSTRRGTSAEFAEYRLYRQGDPLARVDWKLLARTDRAYLRLSPDRTVLPTMIVLDASASMVFPTGVDSKLERARQLCVALTAVAFHGGDPVGAAVAGERLTVFSPRTRGGVIGEVARLLREVRAGSASLIDALHAAARLSQRLVLISDMLDQEDVLIGSLRAHRARGGEAHLVHVIAREEMDPPLGPVHDPERPHDTRVLDETGRLAYVRGFSAWRDGLAARARAAGIAYVLSVTDQTVTADVRRVVAGGRDNLSG